MATVKQGHLTAAGEWWKHLRGTKRSFWKGERRAVKAYCGDELVAMDSESEESKRRVGKRSKPFGVLVTYGYSMFSARMFTWKRWYPSERARQQAMADFNRKLGNRVNYSAKPLEDVEQRS